MIKSIVSKIIKDRKDYIEDLTTLKKREKAYPASHRTDVDGFKGKRVQMDLLFLPTDPQTEAKYLLVAVDNYSGQTDAEPLVNKEAETVREAIDKILNRKIIGNKVYIIQVDNGTEFKKGLKTHLKRKNITLRRAATQRHSQQAMVEARNNIFGSSIMKIQLATELETDETDRRWVYLVKPILAEINKQSKPLELKRTDKVLCFDEAEAKKNKVKLKKNEKTDCDVYSIGDKVYYRLDFPIDYREKKLNGRFRAGDIRYSLKPVKIENILLMPGRPVRYVLEGIKDRTFTKNQLKPEYFIVEAIVGEEEDTYLIKWRGYPESENTYEPKETIRQDVPKLVEQYEKKKKEKAVEAVVEESIADRIKKRKRNKKN